MGLLGLSLLLAPLLPLDPWHLSGRWGLLRPLDLSLRLDRSGRSGRSHLLLLLLRSDLSGRLLLLHLSDPSLLLPRWDL